MRAALGVFVGSAFVAKYPDGGGNFWVPLQYLLGLRALGVDAYWLEVVWNLGDEAHEQACIKAFLGHCERLGVRDRIVLVSTPPDPSGRIAWYDMPEGEFLARARDSLLLNFGGHIGGTLRAGFARTALVDIDPGFLQLWARDYERGLGGYDFGVGAHDVHLTIGWNLGASDCPVPLGNVTWHAIWPPVHVASWSDSGPPGERYTTVTHWWSGEYAFLEGDEYDCNKRSAFVELVELPARAPASLELAANITPGEVEDRELLHRHGWRIADPSRVAGTPMDYRRYVQSSRGEFSCAKPGYVKARAGWISDRTLCYLASGRPCVVQATGAESWLPETRGLRFFRTLDEAVAGLREVEGDYAGASRAARALAREIFDTSVTIPALLEAAGG